MNGKEIKSTSNSANKRSQDQRKSETHKNITVKTNTIPIMYYTDGTRFKLCTFGMEPIQWTCALQCFLIKTDMQS